MGDEATTTKQEAGWVKLYHPSGPLVTIPVTVDALDYGKLLANVSSMLTSGWLFTAPGLEPGEFREEVGWCVKTFVNNSPAIDLYPVEGHYSFMRVYLNTVDQMAAFEFASKLRIADMPEYVGVGKLEREKSPQTDRLFAKPPKPFGVVWKDNPKYNPEETDPKKKKQKRLLVRWINVKPQEQQEEKTTQPEGPFVNENQLSALTAAVGASYFAGAATVETDMLAAVGVASPSDIPARIFDLLMLLVQTECDFSKGNQAKGNGWLSKLTADQLAANITVRRKQLAEKQAKANTEII